MSIIIDQYKAVDTTDGDGVKLKRVFGYYQKEVFDPFLMLDHAESSYPQSGFPWHPHRGIETITYLGKGRAFHEDSLGNKGEMNEGDIQWMKAGSGILHQEFPDKESEEFELIQFWLNMPANEKMSDPEYVYTNVLEDNVVVEGGTETSVIAGTYKGIFGPVQKEARNVTLLFSQLKEGSTLSLPRKQGTNSFLYILKGNGTLLDEFISEYNIYKLKEQDFTIKANSDMKLIFAEGTPLNEDIVWWGPVVMNTREQIKQAQEELQNGTFLKHKKGE